METEETQTTESSSSNNPQNSKIKSDEELIKNLISDATKGDINSLLKLGKLYFHGSWILEYYDEEKKTKIVHTTPNIKESKEIFEKIVKEHKNKIEAIFYLGRIYLFGDENIKNVNKAIEYFEIGAQINHAPSLHFLGKLPLQKLIFF